MRLGKLTSLSVKFFGPNIPGARLRCRCSSWSVWKKHRWASCKASQPPRYGTETWSFTYISAHCAVKDSNSGNYIKRTHRMKYMIFWVHEKNTQITPSHSQLGFASKCLETVTKIFSQMVVWLVVEPTHLKNISQNGNLPQIGLKIKNIWNHHLVV